MALPAPNAPDDLLARYRSARTQQALFDVRPETLSAGTGYDEFLDVTGDVRPAWQEVADCVADRGPGGLDQLRGVVRSLVDNDGITYVRTSTQGTEAGAPQPVGPGPEPGRWHLDALPLVISASDWATLEAGLVQRSRLLDAILADLYGRQLSITSGVLPPQLLYAHPGYIRAARGIQVPGRHQLFLHGCDVSRAADGSFRVNADWTQAPSGAGYALADRRVIAHAAPELYERIGPRPASPWAQALRLALIDAAPESAEEPVVVVLSPGIHSETSFDQAYLASVLGFPLVESADLVVRDGKLWMRSMGTLKRVDVVLRRVDADFVDPLDLRADSRLGVAGLVEALRRGSVTVVNTLGSGILESPGVQRFLPDLARQLLGEEPLLASTPMYWAGDKTERAHLLANLSRLLIRPVTGGRAFVGPALSAAQRESLATRITAVPWQWVGQELPQFSSAPAADRYGQLSVANVGMRLFTVAQRSGYAPLIGGLGYQLASGTGAYTLKTTAAKDVWVRAPERATVEVPPVELPAITPSPTRAVSSPRVLSDLYWIGRYAERAEHMARLLTVTRERYHEFHYRREMEDSAVVPVLLTALGRITGTDTGAGGDYAEMVATAQSTLWSLTADRQRPGSLAQSVERLGLATRAVRDQLSNDTWLVLAAVERALLNSPDTPPDSQAEGAAFLSTATSLTLAGMLALSGVASESMIRDIGWTMMDIGKRIERGQNLTALLNATLTTERSPGAEQTITDSTLVVLESSVIYRRRMLGKVRMSAVAELLLFDADNPRSLAYQLDRLRAGLKALPGSSGSSRPERLVEEIGTRLRRLDPADLETVVDGERTELAALLSGMHQDLRELSAVITATHLSLPGEMQHLWGPDERRLVP
ncbi:circularly permuted type 2 ATP-grasp protein [Mycolicibacterium phlei]